MSQEAENKSDFTFNVIKQREMSSFTYNVNIGFGLLAINLLVWFHKEHLMTVQEQYTLLRAGELKRC